ncbi:MAG: TldD/PmbA family protein, partial [Gemmatimonadota bacterium]|nr:TldD/PmbA family protein [Gemmatimonadota bacterium]
MKPRSLFHSAGAALAPLLTREQSKALADRILAMSTADETRVSINSSWEGNTRFAGGEITTSGEAVNTTVTVGAVVGRRRA